jgi:hypothetical protein
VKQNVFTDKEIDEWICNDALSVTFNSSANPNLTQITNINLQTGKQDLNHYDITWLKGLGFKLFCKSFTFSKVMD